MQDKEIMNENFQGKNMMNNNFKMKMKKWPHFKGELPAYQSVGASGFDVRAQLDGKSLILKKGERALIPTGLSFEIPVGFEIQARPRSGWAAKQGLTLLNTPGTIDADYRGEVKVIVINLGQEDVEIHDQDRCAQFVVAPIYQAQFELVETLSDTERGIGGFGSTGKK